MVQLHIRNHLLTYEYYFNLNKYLICIHIPRMPYPISPFKNGFDNEYFLAGMIDNAERKRARICNILKWLCSTSKYTSFRVNSLGYETDKILEEIKIKVEDVSKRYMRPNPKIEIHPLFEDVILVHNWTVDRADLDLKQKEVIVDTRCGESVLRGAHIFAPGILGMESGTKLDDEVSIYVDIENKCKKGAQTIFQGRKEFIANGKVKMVRYQLFKDVLPMGIAVEVTSTKSGCLPIGSSVIDPSRAVLQNLPSIICTYNLQPQPGEIILDMCASPGNKTTHIAAMMKNSGTLIALDKTPNKIKQLKDTCTSFGANVSVFQADSTKIVTSEKTTNVSEGPPFGIESFDKILLDAPCSAVGKRPQLCNNHSIAVLESHVPLQKKLFDTAVKLLKLNGKLVYSTCSIALPENEGIVAWALNKYPHLCLVKCEPHLGGPGLQCSGLTLEDCRKIQRFGYDDPVDSIGFFIAQFIKSKEKI